MGPAVYFAFSSSTSNPKSEINICEIKEAYKEKRAETKQIWVTWKERSPKTIFSYHSTEQQQSERQRNAHLEDRVYSAAAGSPWRHHL